MILEDQKEILEIQFNVRSYYLINIFYFNTS